MYAHPGGREGRIQDDSIGQWEEQFTSILKPSIQPSKNNIIITVLGLGPH